MNEFWTTILNSPVIASLAECALLCGVILLLQHLYNKKLEEHKADVQKKIDEHQTKFNWWYLEKVKAIKTIYAILANMRFLLQKLLAVDINPDWKKNLSYQEETRNKTYQSFLVASENLAKNWLELRLFFDGIDDMNIAKNISEVADLFRFYSERVTKNEIDDLAQKGPEMLYRIETMMTQLRDDFQTTLGVQKQSVDNGSNYNQTMPSSEHEVK